VIYECVGCDVTRNFEKIANHIRPDERPPTEYTLARCDHCGSVALFHREDMGDGFENDSYYRLWPSHHRHIGFALPDIVRQSYDQAVRCENAKAYIAAAVMIRRALEAVAKQYEPTARSLHDALKGMLSRGLISQELSEWGNELRYIGNLGAHATDETVDREDAVEGLDFLQALLEIFYDLRPRFERMKVRRSDARPRKQKELKQ
jgi:uncharacterized protein DUF4145